MLPAPTQAFGVECATEAQRKVEIETLNESVDWFLSTVAELPEDIAQHPMPRGSCSVGGGLQFPRGAPVISPTV